jgi:hypothetical protein
VRLVEEDEQKNFQPQTPVAAGLYQRMRWSTTFGDCQKIQDPGSKDARLGRAKKDANFGKIWPLKGPGNPGMMAVAWDERCR